MNGNQLKVCTDLKYKRSVIKRNSLFKIASDKTTAETLRDDLTDADYRLVFDNLVSKMLIIVYGEEDGLLKLSELINMYLKDDEIG